MKISDAAPSFCECISGKLIKLMSRTNFVLKGQGYETDFKIKIKIKVLIPRSLALVTKIKIIK